MEKELTLKDIHDQIKDIHDQIGMFTKIAATKEDLNGFATKEDLENLKTELKSEINTARDAVLAHADKKSESAIIESGKKINQHKEHDKNFKQKLISVMKNHDLASASELKSLAQTI